MWPGEAACILGGGPSLTVEQIAHVRGKARVVCVNDSYLLAPWADWLHGSDYKWWLWHRDKGALAFPGIRTTVTVTLPKAWARLLKPSGNTGFDPDPSCVRTGASGVYQAIHALVHAGVARVLLLGVDMQNAPDGRTHWHGGHPDGMTTDFETVMAPKFETLKPALAERGVEVLNCSPGSALQAFPLARLEDAI